MKKQSLHLDLIETKGMSFRIKIENKMDLLTNNYSVFCLECGASLITRKLILWNSK